MKDNGADIDTPAREADCARGVLASCFFRGSLPCFDYAVQGNVRLSLRSLSVDGESRKRCDVQKGPGIGPRVRLMQITWNY